MREAVPEDAGFLLCNLHPASDLEFRAMGVDPREEISQRIEASSGVFAVEAEGEGVWALFGVIDIPGTQWCGLWGSFSRVAEAHPVAVCRGFCDVVGVLLGKYDRVWVSVVEDNRRMLGLCERVGFREEGRMPPFVVMAIDRG